MPADINSYALGIELNLQDAATPQLRIIGAELLNIEQQVNDLATKTMGGLNSVTTQIADSLLKIATLQSKINSSTLTNIKPLTDTSSLHKQEQRILADESVLLKDKMGQYWIAIVKKLEEKNRLIKEESRGMEQETTQIEKAGKGFSMWGNHINKAGAELRQFLAGLANVRAAITEALNETEQFVTANFRLYGSQNDLMARANELTMQYGLLKGQAVEALKELGNLKIPIEMMDELVATTAMFSRATGVSIPQTAQWNKMLVSTGASAAEVTRQAEYMTVSMRKFGVSSKDLSALMGTQTSQFSKLVVTLGITSTKRIQEAQNVWTGFYTSLDVNAESIKNLNNAVGTLNLTDLAQIQSFTKEGLDSAESWERANIKLVSGLAERLKAEENAAGGALDHAQQMMIAKQFTGIYTNDAYANSLVEIAAQRATSKSFKDTADELEKLAAARKVYLEGAKLQAAADEANRGVLAQLNQLQTAFSSTLKVVWAQIAPLIIEALTWINTFVQYVTAAIAKVSAWLDTLGPIGGQLKTIGAILITLIAVFIGALVVMNSFGAAGKVIGTTAKHALGGVSEGLEKLAVGLKAIQPYIPALLALSALFLSVGLAAFFLALAVSIIAAQGEAGINALIALTAAILILGLGLALIGLIAIKAAPGLFALAAAFLSVGISALLIGVAIYLIAAAFDLFVTTLAKLNAGLVKNLYDFALALIQAAPVLMAAGLVLLVAGILLAVGGIALLAASLVILVATVFLAVSALLIFYAGSLIAIGGLAIIIGATLLMIGSVLLIVAAPLILLASLILLPGAIALLIVGLILAPAALLIGLAGLFLLIGGLGIWLGGMMMLAGAPLLVKAAGPLFKAALALMFVGPMLLAASIPIGLAGIALLIGGLGVLLGGLFLYLGALLLSLSAPLLQQAAPKLLEAAETLAPAVFELALLAIPFAIAAFVIFVASVLFFIAAVALFYGATIFIGAAILVSECAIILAPAAESLFISGAQILIASIGLFIAGILLFFGGILLGIGAVAIGVAAIGIGLAGGALWLASWPFDRGVNAIMKSAKKFAEAAYLIVMPALALNAILPVLANAFREFGTTMRSLGDELSIPIADLIADFANNTAFAAAVLYDSLTGILIQLESYGDRISRQADAIAASFLRVIPAMMLGGLIGLGPIKAETIVKPSGAAEVFQETEHRLLMIEQQKDQIFILGKIWELVAKLKIDDGGGEKSLAEILALLREHLPKVSRGRDSGFTSAFSNWKR